MATAIHKDGGTIIATQIPKDSVAIVYVLAADDIAIMADCPSCRVVAKAHTIVTSPESLLISAHWTCPSCGHEYEHFFDAQTQSRITIKSTNVEAS